jgi:hypothetical protein
MYLNKARIPNERHTVRNGAIAITPVNSVVDVIRRFICAQFQYFI